MDGVSPVGMRAEDQVHYLMGLWGSAFAANFKEMYNALESSLPSFFRSLFRRFVNWGDIGDSRLPGVVGFVNNPARGMKDVPTSGDKYLQLVDAGLCFNLPVPPLTRRKSDVIIVCDLSDSTEKLGNKQLWNAWEYLGKRGVPFPKIERQVIGREVVVTKYQDEGTPMIIYMQATGKDFFRDPKFQPSEKMPTFTFDYDPSVVVDYNDLIDAIVQRAVPELRTLLSEAIAQKKK